MVVLSVQRRQLRWRYLFYGESYGGVICSKATVMVVLSALWQKFSWCYRF